MSSNKGIKKSEGTNVTFKTRADIEWRGTEKKKKIKKTLTLNIKIETILAETGRSSTGKKISLSALYYDIQTGF